MSELFKYKKFWYIVVSTIFILSMTVIFNTDVNAADSVKVSWIKQESEIYDGDKPTFLVMSQNAYKVQYKFWYYDYTKQVWGELGSGYTDPVDSINVYSYKSSVSLKPGKYKFIVWVRKEGSTANYEDYTTTEGEVKEDSVKADGTVITDKETYNLGETVNVNGISNISGGNGSYSYKLFAYDVKRDKWITVSQNYSKTIQWVPKLPGTYMLDVYAKADDSQSNLDIYRLKNITVNGPSLQLVNAINVSTTINSAPVLPSSIDAQFSDGSKRKVNVNWSGINPSAYSKAGSFKATGVIEGTDIKVSCNVTVNTLNNGATVKWFNIGSSLVNGSPVNFYAVANGNGKVCYRLWYYSYTDKKWGEATNGYTQSVDANIPYKINLNKIFNLGSYKFVLWVKNPSSTNDQDNYSTIEVPCTNIVKSTGGDVSLSKNNLLVGETLKVNGIAGLQGNYQFKIFAYNTDTGNWYAGSDYSNNPTWIPSCAGNYIIDVYAKVAGSQNSYDFYKLTSVSVGSTSSVAFTENVSVNTYENIAPVLPSTVQVTLLDGSLKYLPVTWNTILPQQYSTSGNFKVNGTIAETNTNITADVNVKADNLNPAQDWLRVSQNVMSGEKPSFIFKLKDTNKVQYRLWYYDYTSNSWGELTNGYSDIVDTNNVYQVDSKVPFYAGNYKAVLWLKKPNSTNEQDSYFVSNFTVSPTKMHVLGEAKVDNSTYKVGDCIKLNGVDGLSDGSRNYSYSLSIYNIAGGNWITDMSGYKDAPTWIPKVKGQYLMLASIKSKTSDYVVQNYKYIPITVTNSNEEYTTTRYSDTFSTALQLQMQNGGPTYDDGGNWPSATQDMVEYYLNPYNFENDSFGKFQFLKLSYNDCTTVDELNKVLSGKGILSNMGSVFMSAAKNNNVSPIYLVAHTLLETGNGTSELSNGVVVNGVKYYNMFGIHAFDSDPIYYGSHYAAQMGWDTVEKAISGGAAWISSGYINGSLKQDTLYKMRWDPQKPAYHQYATDIRWAYNQIFVIKNLIDKMPGLKLIFDLPLYN